MMNDITPTPEFEEQVRQAVITPNVNPEFVKQLRQELARRPARMKPKFIFKPIWALVLALFVLAVLASVPVTANALKRLLGYLPGVGLVENTGGLRMLAEPVSVTRDSITVTITHVMVYHNRVELTYEVDGVKEIYSNASDICGSYHPDNNFWSDADADLRLPDGTLVRRDYAGEFQFENRYAMKPVYAVQVPAGVTELTMVLKCIPFSRLGEVPENWEISFQLVSIPDGAVAGAPVIEVAPTIALPETPVSQIDPNVPAPVTTMTFKRVVSLDSVTVFYLSMDMINKDPSLISIIPVNVFVIDSTGQKSQLVGNFPWQPFKYRVGSEFEFVSQSKPADGPLTVVVENAVAYYAPLFVEPPQATPEDMSFTFDAGDAPQQGQTWQVNNDFTIVGYNLKVTTVKAVTWDDVKIPESVDGSQGFDYGYLFTMESSPSVKFSAEMDIMSDALICGMTNIAWFVPSDSSLQYAQLCQGTYPQGLVKVTIRELSILLENIWQSTWVP